MYNHSMIEHHLQKTILRKLGSFDSARFSDLKPANVEGNVYTYHLQQLIKSGLISKNDDNSYSLSSLGKEYLVTTAATTADQHQQAHSVLLLAVQRGNEWLVRKRCIQPNLGLTGFVHGEPKPGEAVEVTAQARLLQKTGLTAEFIVRGSGLVQIYRGPELESFSHCIVLYANNPSGTLLDGDETGENSWVSATEFDSPQYLPSMPLLHDLLAKSEQFFFDKTYTL